MTDIDGPPLGALLISTAMGYVTPRALHVVAELGVADALGEEPRDAASLAADTGADADALNRLMRLLAANGIFGAEAGRFRHNEASLRLRADHPESVRAFVLMMGAGWNWGAFGELGHSARTGETGMSKRFGAELFDYLSRHEDEARMFDAAMTARAQGAVPAIVAAYDFSGFGRIADIGGGRGHLLAAVLAACPLATGVLFDLPGVVAAALPDETGRREVVGGDFLRDPLPASDGYVIWNIIHDWPDAESVAILSAVRSAAPSGARVLLIETPMPQEPTADGPAVGDIVMLAAVNGRERTVAEYRALLDAAGLRLDRVLPTAAGYAVLEAVPA